MFARSVLQEARQLAESWKEEAQEQRKAAASASAAETQRLIKQLQDKDVERRALLLDKDMAIAQVGCFKKSLGCWPQGRAVAQAVVGAFWVGPWH